MVPERVVVFRNAIYAPMAFYLLDDFRFKVIGRNLAVMLQVWEKLLRVYHIHVDIVEITDNHIGPALELVEVHHLGNLLGFAPSACVSEYHLAVSMVENQDHLQAFGRLPRNQVFYEA